MKINWEKYDIDVTKGTAGKTFCPKCHPTRKDKRDRSLSYDKDSGVFKCHYPSCGYHGKAIDRDDVLIQGRPSRTYTTPVPRLQLVGDDILNWFKGRGIDNNTLLRFRVTESSEWMPGCESGQKVSTICFNYFRGEQLVNIKYRSPDKTFRMEKGAELILYNLGAAGLGKELVIVEGEIDALSMWQAGVCNVVSVPNGASISSHAKLEYLDNCWQDLEHLEKIIIAVDDDEAGRSLKAELVRRLGPERCWQVCYPSGCKDANEVLIQQGSAVLKQMIVEAEMIPLEGVATVYDERFELMDLYESGLPHGPYLGWQIDQYVRFRTGLLTIITGTPGSGKSTWLNNVLIRLAQKANWPIAMFSPEKTPVKYLIAELITIHNGMPMYRSDPTKKISKHQLLESADFLDRFFYFLRVGEVDRSVDGLLTKAAECVKRYGIKALVIDPWNYIDHKRNAGTTETDYIGQSLSKIADFCKKYDVHVFVIAHPAKPTKGSGNNYVPTMNDISGSANFNNMTDFGITVHRDRKENCTEIHIKKVRWWWDGKEGIAKQYFNLDSQRYQDHPPLHVPENYVPFNEPKSDREDASELPF